MSKGKIKSLLERVRASVDGHKHLGTETKINRDDLRSVVEVLEEILNTKSIGPVNNG